MSQEVAVLVNRAPLQRHRRPQGGERLFPSLSGIPCKSRFDQASINRSSKKIARWALAMPHSRGGIFQSFVAWFNTRYRSFSTLSSVGKWPRVRTARRSLEPVRKHLEADEGGMMEGVSGLEAQDVDG